MAPLFAAVLTAIAVLVGDVTGTWTGTLTPDGRDAGPALLVLQQEGSTVTGTAGATADSDRHQIRNGVLKGDVVTFDIETPNGVMKFDLKLNGDELTGTVVRDREGDQTKAALAVKRSK